MKWILLLVILAAVAAVLYTRSMRASSDASDGTGPHRLDDSMSDSPPDDDPSA